MGRFALAHCRQTILNLVQLGNSDQYTCTIGYGAMLHILTLPPRVPNYALFVTVYLCMHTQHGRCFQGKGMFQMS